MNFSRCFKDSFFLSDLVRGGSTGNFLASGFLLPAVVPDRCAADGCPEAPRPRRLSLPPLPRPETQSGYHRAATATQ